MTDDSPPAQPVKTAGNVGGLYADAHEALDAVRESFHYWSGKLTDSSFTLSAAVIGANWAVFGGAVENLLSNPWAVWSVAVVVVSFGINLLGVRLMTEQLRGRMHYAEEDPTRWSKEFNETLGKKNPWPYPESVDRLALALRECRTWFPILGGVLFLIALVYHIVNK